MCECRWLPIATAPRDGTRIIVSGGVAHWHDGAWWTLMHEPWPGSRIEWSVRWWMPWPVHPADRLTPPAATSAEGGA